MQIRIPCPCGRMLMLEGSAVGKKARCSACQGLVPVPARRTCGRCGTESDWSAESCSMCQEFFEGASAAHTPSTATRRTPNRAMAATASGVALVIALLLAAAFAPLARCAKCNGSGVVVDYQRTRDAWFSRRIECPDCDGRGSVTISRSLGK